MLSSRILVPINMLSRVEEVDQTVSEPLFPQTMALTVSVPLCHWSLLDPWWLWMLYGTVWFFLSLSVHAFMHGHLRQVSNFTMISPSTQQRRGLIMSNVSLCFPLLLFVETVFAFLTELHLDLWWLFMFYGTVRFFLFLSFAAFMHSYLIWACIFTMFFFLTQRIHHIIVSLSFLLLGCSNGFYLQHFWVYF